jgi:hypothetical protein
MSSLEDFNVFPLTCFTCYITFFICYQLALAFLDLSPAVKSTLIPVLVTSIIAYISKICFNASAPVHTVAVVIICTGVLYFFNPISILFSLIGSLLTIITLTFGSLVVACPLYYKMGFVLPSGFNGRPWLLLAFLEMIVPFLVLIIIKVSKFSLMRFIFNITP